MNTHTYKISKDNTSIVSLEVAENIYEKINELLKKHDHIIFDFENLNSITTSCAKSIFGRLYIEIGSEKFRQKISFKNTDKEMQIIIHEGITSFIENNKK